MRGVTHSVQVATKRNGTVYSRTREVRVCVACGIRDRHLRRIEHTAYLGVHRGLAPITDCDHPFHGKPATVGSRGREA